MATALTLQSYGAAGTAVTLAAADANGNTITGNDRPGVMLIARNAGAGDLTVRIASAAYCSHEIATHYMDVTIPNDSLRHAILLGVDDVARKRFGSIVSIEYPGGVTSLTVGAARADNHGGRGNAVASPPSLGSGAVTITLTAEGEELYMTAAVSAGAIMPNTDGRSRLVIHNTGVATRTVYVLPMAYCDQGFTDCVVYTIEPGEIRTVERLFPTGRFGYEVGITYDSATGLEFGAVRQGTYAG